MQPLASISLCFKLFIATLSLAAIFAAARATGPGNGSELENSAANQLVGLLFGKNLWKFNEYCNEKQNPRTTLDEDMEINRFYQMTDAAHQAAEMEPGLNQDRLNYLGIRARNRNSVMCAPNAWGYADDETFSLSNSPADDYSECKAQLDQLSFKVKRLVASSQSKFHLSRKTQDIGAIAGYESFGSYGRVPPGELYKTHHWLGKYTDCLADDSRRYCIGAYRMLEWPQVNRSVAGSYSYRVGMCLPKACNSRAILADVDGDYLGKLDQIVKFNLISGFKLTDANKYQLVDLHCLPTQDSQFVRPFRELGAKLLAALLVVWLMITVYANLPAAGWPQEGAQHQEGKKQNSVLACFNLKTNYTAFKRTGNPTHELAGLNFFKVTGFFWLLCAHCFLISISFLFSAHDIRREWKGSYIGGLILQGQHGVPIFFIISGLLVGYKHLKTLDKSRHSVKYWSFVLHRYLRLAPMYLIVYAYVRQFSHLIGSGPMWDYGVSANSEANQCRQESWLVPMLMLANFIYPFSHCILTGWHIANDFQIYLILPGLIWLYSKSRALGNAVAVVGFLASHLYHAWNFHSSPYFSYELLTSEPYVFGPRYIIERMAYDYVNPIGRLGTYFLGFFLADLLLAKRRGKGAGQSQADACNKCDRPPVADTCQGTTSDISGGSGGSGISNSVSVGHDNCCRPAVCKRLGMTITGLGLLIISILGFFIFESLKHIFDPYGKSISYPACRLVVEIGWFLLLYSLILGNIKGGSSSSSSSGGGDKRQLDDCGFSGAASARVTRKPDGGRLAACSQKATRTGDGGSGRTKLVAGAVGAALTRVTLGAHRDIFRLAAWDILVKLNYSLMLTHFTVAKSLIQTQTLQLDFSHLTLAQLTCLFMLACYLVALIVHLFLELPLASLMGLLVSRLERSAQDRGATTPAPEGSGAARKREPQAESRRPAGDRLEGCKEPCKVMKLNGMLR